MLDAILFGSIGTIAETSEIQRQSFNEAFAVRATGWHWDRATYRRLLQVPGGRARLRAYAAERGEALLDSEIEDLQREKSIRFQDRLIGGAAGPRPGVRRLLAEARSEGVVTALVSTTSTENVVAVLCGARLTGAFDLVVDETHIADLKPAPDCYRRALAKLGLSARRCVAIEDSAASFAAASAAGLPGILVLGENTAEDRADAARSVLTGYGEASRPAQVLAGIAPPGGCVTVDWLRDHVADQQRAG